MGRATQRDKLVESVLDVLEDLQDRVRRLEVSHPGQPGTGAGTVAFFGEDGILDASVGSVRLRVVEDDVSNPPTDAQLDAAFGEPSEVGEGFVAWVDDNGAGTTIWLVGVVNGAWRYELFGTAS